MEPILWQDSDPLTCGALPPVNLTHTPTGPHCSHPLILISLSASAGGFGRPRVVLTGRTR